MPARAPLAAPEGPPRLGAESSVGRTPLIGVLVVDDHQLVTELLAATLRREPSMEMVGMVDSLAALSAFQGGQPDVVLMDYALPDGTGADGCRLAKARWPRARVIVLTAGASDAATLSIVEAGADGYLLKSGRVSELVAAIRAAFEGRLVLAPALIGQIARALPDRRPERVLSEPLTPRELMVLRALCRGASTRAIADELGMRQGTVRVHVEAIRRKFGVGSKLEAVSAALRHRIVEMPGLEGHSRG